MEKQYSQQDVVIMMEAQKILFEAVLQNTTTSSTPNFREVYKALTEYRRRVPIEIQRQCTGRLSMEHLARLDEICDAQLRLQREI